MNSRLYFLKYYNYCEGVFRRFYRIVIMVNIFMSYQQYIKACCSLFLQKRDMKYMWRFICRFLRSRFFICISYAKTNFIIFFFLYFTSLPAQGYFWLITYDSIQTTRLISRGILIEPQKIREKGKTLRKSEKSQGNLRKCRRTFCQT